MSSLLFAVSASAFPALKHEVKANKMVSSPLAAITQHADFSGKWVTTSPACVGEEGGQEIIVIKNDASQITIDGETFPLDGSVSTASAEIDNDYGAQITSLHWSHDGSTVLIQGVQVDKDQEDENLQTSLVNWKLRKTTTGIELSGEQVNYDGVSLTADTPFVCSYTAAE